MALPEARLLAAVRRSGVRVRMPRALRFTVYATCGLLWLTGALWLLLHHGFAQHNEFGVLPNPWEPGLMRLHGALAVGAVFLLGWIAADHIPAGWPRVRNRASGLWLSGCAIVLVVSGYALYYSTGALHDGAGSLHQWLGIAALLAALAHWWRARGTRD